MAQPPILRKIPVRPAPDKPAPFVQRPVPVKRPVTTDIKMADLTAGQQAMLQGLLRAGTWIQMSATELGNPETTSLMNQGLVKINNPARSSPVWCISLIGKVVLGVPDVVAIDPVVRPVPVVPAPVENKVKK